MLTAVIFPAPTKFLRLCKVNFLTVLYKGTALESTLSFIIKVSSLCKVSVSAFNATVTTLSSLAVAPPLSIYLKSILGVVGVGVPVVTTVIGS